MSTSLKFTDERQLWIALCQGDEEAFRQIYDQYVPGLYSYGIKMVRDEELVKDCIQDLLVRIWNNRRSLGLAQSIKLYLSAALRRDLVRQLRQQKGISLDEVETYDFNITLDVEALVIQQEMQQEQVQRLTSSINKLPPRQKEALYLRYYENLSYEEIATLMDITPGVAYNFVYRAILFLKKYLIPAILFLALHKATQLFNNELVNKLHSHLNE